jgi:hypothetical protein
LYLVNTSLLSGIDPKPKRPAVVVALPAYGLTDVPVLTRTTDTSERGVGHPANAALGLTKPGVFAYRFLRSMDSKYFARAEITPFLGMLETVYFEQIVTWWEAG